MVKAKATSQLGGRGARPPLTWAQVRREVRPRPALKPETNLTIRYSSILPATRTPEVKAQPRDELSHALGIEITKPAADLGRRVFPPSVPGKQLRRVTAKRAAVAAQDLLIKADPYLPDHLPMRPVPLPLEKELRVRRYYKPLGKKTRAGIQEATTVFPPDDRYVFSDTAYPWCTVGRVETAGGTGSGVLVGPRHLLTASHLIVWNPDNSCGWVYFSPSYFDLPGPFGDAWATAWIAFYKVVGPDIDSTEGQFDYAILVLDWEIGRVCGWMGTMGYDNHWNGGAYFAHIGYPGDIAAFQRPTFQKNIALNGTGVEDHERMWHYADVWPGQSGGPFFAWLQGEVGPRVVAGQSGQGSNINSASGGNYLAYLHLQGLNDFP